MSSESIVNKNAGKAPTNKPIVVNPNAIPGLFFNLDTNNANVTGIVILNNIIPINDRYILWLPNSRKGNANTVLTTDVIFIFALSINRPPKALPIPIKQNNNIIKLKESNEKIITIYLYQRFVK